MSKLKITQVRSLIGRSQTQKRTIEALGLGRIRQTVEHADSPQLKGMLAKVRHLVEVEEA